MGIGIVALGVCALILLIAAFGLLWALRLKPVTSTTVLLVLVLCVYPLMGVVGQIVEYRRASSLLELLDVLERETHIKESGDQQAKT